MQKKHLKALHEGKMSFSAFARLTRRDWERLADALMQRWWPGPEVDREDVIQELLLAASVAIKKFEPGRSDLHGYIVFNAMDKAKKWLVRCRGLGNREEGMQPSSLSDGVELAGHGTSPVQFKATAAMERIRLLGPGAVALLESEGRVQAAARMLRERTGKSLAQATRDVQRIAKVLSPA